MEERQINIGFSPCPNDTFIFDAMINNRIDTEGFVFKPVMADVEELNRKAFLNELEVTKLSFHAFLHICDKYVLLRSGSALGNNCGPILISRQKYTKEDVEQLKIAIPGKYTTANFLLHHAFPNLSDPVEMTFNEIEGAIEDGSVDAGLIIHENRFTYEAKGLNKMIDLGEHWYDSTSAPIPLGGIAVSRELDTDTQVTINRVLRRSVEFAMNSPAASIDFVKAHSQEMEDSVIKQHIELYVNDFTKDLGDKGVEAINIMLANAKKRGIVNTDAGIELFVPR